MFSSFQVWQPEDRIYPCAILFMVILSILRDKKQTKKIMRQKIKVKRKDIETKLTPRL